MRLKTQIPDSLLLLRLLPAAPSHCEWTIGVSGWYWTLTMPSLGVLASGVMLPLELRDFFVGLIGGCCGTRDALRLIQRYIEHPKPMREPQSPEVGDFSSGLIFLR